MAPQARKHERRLQKLVAMGVQPSLGGAKASVSRHYVGLGCDFVDERSIRLVSYAVETLDRRGVQGYGSPRIDEACRGRKKRGIISLQK